MSDDDIIELERLIAAVDFGEIADRGKRGAVVDDTASVRVQVKHDGSVLSFDAPLPYWAWARAKGHQSYLPLFDFDPALRLWEAVNRCSPHKL